MGLIEDPAYPPLPWLELVLEALREVDVYHPRNIAVVRHRSEPEPIPPKIE